MLGFKVDEIKQSNLIQEDDLRDLENRYGVYKVPIIYIAEHISVHIAIALCNLYPFKYTKRLYKFALDCIRVIAVSDNCKNTIRLFNLITSYQAGAITSHYYLKEIHNLINLSDDHGFELHRIYGFAMMLNANYSAANIAHFALSMLDAFYFYDEENIKFKKQKEIFYKHFA